MRALWVTHSTLGTGGTLCQTASRGTVGSLNNHGWDVVILSKCSKESKGINEIDGVKWHHIESETIRGLKSIMLERSVKKELKKASKALKKQSKKVSKDSKSVLRLWGKKSLERLTTEVLF